MPAFLNDFSLPTVVASVVSSVATVWLLALKGIGGHLADRLLARHKSELDKEFESYRDALERKLKRLEAELGRCVYVTQARFDVELDATKDVFAALGKLRLAFNALRPDFSVGSAEQEARLEALRSQIGEFRDFYNVLVSVAESAYIFLPEEIYEQVRLCVETARTEIVLIDTLHPKFSLEWFDDGRQQREKFRDAYSKAAGLARERFKTSR